METVPLIELSSLAEDIRVRTREALQNNDLNIHEFLGVDKALHFIQGELVYIP